MTVRKVRVPHSKVSAVAFAVSFLKGEKPMNIILVISDTFRRDHLGCYGNSWIHTPNLDRFASESMAFDNAYTASFPTGPHRKDLHTGRFTFAYTRWTEFERDEIALSQVLSDAGYATALIGDTPTLPRGFQRGFKYFEFTRKRVSPEIDLDSIGVRLPAAPEKLRDPYGESGWGCMRILRENILRLGEEDHNAPRTMRAAVRWLERYYRKAPFFLCVDTFDPHEPWDAPPWYTDMYDPGYDGDILFFPAYQETGYCSDREIEHMRAIYAAKATMVDRWIGYLLDAIDILGLGDNTAVIFSTDHGFYHADHGYIGKVKLTWAGRGETERIVGRWPLYDQIIRIPLMARTPGIEGERRSDAFTQPPDIMPTVLDLAGAKIPKSVQGISLLPVIEGKRGSAWPDAISSLTFVQDETCRSPSTLTSKEWTFVYGGDEAPDALYHRPSDPGLERNMIDEKPRVAQELHGRYIERLEELKCPRKWIEGRQALGGPKRGVGEIDKWL